MPTARAQSTTLFVASDDLNDDGSDPTTPTADSVKQVIVSFNAQTSTYSAIVTNAIAPGTLIGGVSLRSPQGVAVDGGGNLYVADAFNDRIVRRSSTGALSVFATLNAGDSPQGLAFDRLGNLFVSTNLTGRLFQFFASGQNLSSTPTELVLNGGQLNQPQFLATDASNRVYIANPGPSTSPQGAPGPPQVLRVDTVGAARGTSTVIADPSSGLTGPVGIAVRNNGQFFVGDTGNQNTARNALVGFSMNGGSALATYALPGTAGVDQPMGLGYDRATDRLFFGRTDFANTGEVRLLNFADTSATGSFFIANIINPTGMAVLVPEPATGALVLVALVAGRMRRRITRA